MEGATRGVISPCLAQWHVGVDQIDNINPVQQLLNEGLGNHV